VTPHRRIQKRTKQGNQEKIGRGRKPPQYDKRMVRKSSQTRQEPEAE